MLSGFELYPRWVPLFYPIDLLENYFFGVQSAFFA